MRLLVCGGREYTDRARTFAEMDRIHGAVGIDLVVHGACRKKGELAGADRWAQEWAQENEIAYLGIPAKWNTHGRPAGPIRNADMLRRAKPDYALAMPGGTGTADMIGRCAAAGIETTVIE